MWDVLNGNCVRILTGHKVSQNPRMVPYIHCLLCSSFPIWYTNIYRAVQQLYTVRVGLYLDEIMFYVILLCKLRIVESLNLQTK